MFLLQLLFSINISRSAMVGLIFATVLASLIDEVGINLFPTQTRFVGMMKLRGFGSECAMCNIMLIILWFLFLFWKKLIILDCFLDMLVVIC